MNKKIIFTIILVLTVQLLFTGCSSGNSNTDVYYADVTTAVPDEPAMEETAKEAISLKYTDIINSNTVKGTPLTNTPYYKAQLTEPAQTAMDDIVDGIVEYRDYITLRTSITESELIKIMNIIMTNVPEAFHCDFSYKYDINVSGYIKNFYPVYSMDYATYASIKDSMERDLISTCNDKSIGEYSFVSNIYSKLYSQMSSSPLTITEPTTKSNNKTTLLTSTYASQSMASQSLCGKFTSLGAAKYMQYYCNYMGIENITVLGELVDNSFGIQDLYPEDEFISYEKDGIRTVKMNLNNYHAWNLIRIGGLWTNCDVALDAYFSSKDGSSYGAFLCVPDEITRQTRLFQINNELLGMVPSCSSMNFQHYARQYYFITNYTDEQIQECVDTFIESLDYNRNSNATIQFESEANYITFCNLFKERMELYNQTHNQIMPKYNIKTRDYCLTFEISGIVFAQ